MNGKSSAIFKVLIACDTPAKVAGTLDDLKQLVEEYSDEQGCDPGELMISMECEK